MRTIEIQSKSKKYPIIIENNLLDKLRDYLDIERFYVIISDDLIPEEYVSKVKSACKNNIYIGFPSGENSKSYLEYQRIISIMQENNITRDACIIALGGGVTGDLAGFIASTYLRGIDYIQIPTSLLAQIDSSIGGKVAINTDKAKNSVGSFYSPIKVLIDPKTLDTLPERQFSNGMSEMIKYGMIYSEKLFNDILTKNIKDDLNYFITESLLIKKYFVENDEFDKSIRQMLNYGHTFGHAYESYYNFEKYLHGEAVALGMIKVCDNPDIKALLIEALKRFNLPTNDLASEKELLPYIKNDKKNTDQFLNLIVVNELGKAEIKQVSR